MDRAEGAVPEEPVAVLGIDDGEALAGFGADDEAVRWLRRQGRAEEGR